VGRIVEIRAREKFVSLQTELASDLPEFVCWDEKRLSQILLNLLSNAVKFTEKGRVTLTVVRDSNENRIRFSVADTGIGIPKELLADVFEPFQQVGTLSRKIGGTGLGLSISRQLVALMGGELQVESRVGEGSEFTFDLALVEGNGQTSIAETSTDKPVTEDEIQYPATREIQILLQAAKGGDILEIRSNLDRIESADRSILPFTREIRKMAIEFRIRDIRNYLAQILENKE